MRKAVAFLGLVGAILGGFWAAWHAGYAASEDAAARAVAQARQRASAVSVRVVTRYVARAAQIHTVYRTIHDDIPSYITPETDLRYPLPWGFVRLHDAAAEGVLPGAPEATDGTASDVKASEAAGVIISNYEGCTVDRARLTALQAWVKALSDSPNADTVNGSPG